MVSSLPSHLLDRISPIFSPFFPVFCAFSPSRRDGSNEPQAGTQGQETAGARAKTRDLGTSFDAPDANQRINWYATARCRQRCTRADCATLSGGARRQLQSQKSQGGGRSCDDRARQKANREPKWMWATVIIVVPVRELPQSQVGPQLPLLVPRNRAVTPRGGLRCCACLAVLGV